MTIHAKIRMARWLCMPAALALSCFSLPVQAQNNPAVMSQLPAGGNALPASSPMQEMQKKIENLSQQWQKSMTTQVKELQLGFERQEVIGRVRLQMKDPPNDAQMQKLQELAQRAQEAQSGPQSPERVQQMVQYVLQNLQQPAQQSPQAADPMQGAQQAQSSQPSQGTQQAQKMQEQSTQQAQQTQEQSTQQAQQTQEQKAQQQNQTTEAQRILEMQKEAATKQIEQMQKQQQVEPQTQSQSQNMEKLQKLYQVYFGKSADSGTMTDLAAVSQTIAVSMTATLGGIHQQLQQNPNFFQLMQPFDLQGLEPMPAAKDVMEQIILTQFTNVFAEYQKLFIPNIFAEMGLNPDLTPGSSTFGGGTTSTSSGGCPPGQTFIIGVGCV